MPSRFAMVVDSSRCIDCKGCMASCKVANRVPDGHWRNWIKRTVPDFSQGPRTRMHFQPGGCMHCDNPTCVAACPTGATFKDKATGEVIIDRSLCIGCGNCIPACPYGARYRHPELKVADKCDFCRERREHGLEPACVDTCPTKARVFGDLDDPDSEVSRLLRENQGKVVRLTSAGTDTKPNMYYLGGTAPRDWPVEPREPSSMTALASLAGPLVKGAVALTGLGVLAMLGRQILISRGAESSETKHKE
ncbi:4Fe-4S dicluster domain-containing protein [Desulfovibrio aminophilus]|uniref:4Fe-4S dicluster domain-containing protein n=1 Tax=Desulfovibrio aminophilus TaxID=81425 RepID=UPI0003FC27CA|nr:4Fe-4S dicluster domain-containing protein [Desulfovibrio aminophilus]